MSVKRFVAEKDTTITNAFLPNLVYRATGSNIGGSDVLEVFQIYGQANSSSVELSRILLQFPIDEIYEDMSSGSIPDSGVKYYLKVFNVEHGETVPLDYTLEAYQLSRSFDEGMGLDMENYAFTGSGASWNSASAGVTAWSTAGGDVVGSPITQIFDTGVEDFEVDITSFVEGWIEYEASGTGQQNFGILIKLSGSQETAEQSYYTKRFSARTSEYFYKRPIIEARFNDAKADDRGNFYASSSLSADNSNKLYFYNLVRGQYEDVPGGAPAVRFYTTETGSVGISASEGAAITGTRESLGVYYVTATVDTSEEIIWDRWFNVSGACLFTGSIEVKSLETLSSRLLPEYVVSMTNMKSIYRIKETAAKFRLYSRRKNWDPTIYTVAVDESDNEIIEKAYYQIRRVVDDLIVLDFNTSDDESATLMSYDEDGNYFSLDLSMFEPGFQYEIVVAFDIGGELRVCDETFRFRLEE